MTNIVIPIKDLTYSVERPIVFDIVKQIMDITEISSRTPVRVFGDENKALQKNTAIDEEFEKFNKWPFDDKITVEAVEEYDPSTILSTSVKDNEQLIIFRDESLNVIIKPVYAVTNVTINVHYRCTDKSKADAWRNNIRIKTSMGRDINLHELTYSYHLPEEMVFLLKEIHRLRENQGGYNQGFDDYFTSKLTAKASTVSNMEGNYAHWVIAEKQIRVQGFFDFQGVPEKPEKQGDSATYKSSFSYKFTYDKPLHCNMVYPIMIHNQLMGKKYRHTELDIPFEERNISRTNSSLNLSKFEEVNRLLQYYGNKGIPIPKFDNDFMPNSIPSATARVFTALCNITPLDKKTLFNFNELGEFVIDPDILDFIKLERQYLPITYSSIFCLNLYENNYLRESDSLLIDSDLNVTSRLNLDIRKTYRVRLSLIVNLAQARPEVTDRLKQQVLIKPILGIKIARAINSVLRDIGNNPDINTSELTDRELIRIGVIPNQSNPNSNYPVTNYLYDENEIRRNLVQSLFVVASPT